MIAKFVAFYALPKEFKKIETILPEINEDEILVKNEFTTLCRSDLYTYSGIRKEKDPTILGHEIVGRIYKMGKLHPNKDLKGNELKIGDRITWAIFAADPDSPLSKRGIPQKSSDLFKYGHEEINSENILHGGLSEYIILRKNTQVVKINEDVPIAVASLINCSVATVAGSLRLAGDITGKNILICGTGMLGIVACAMASTLKANNIITLDIQNERLQTALEFGAQEILLINKGKIELKKQYLAEKGVNISIDVLLDFSGTPEAIESCMEALNIGGTAIFIGSTFPQRKIEIDAEQVVRKILTIKGLHNYNVEDFLTAVNFIESYHSIFPLESLIRKPYFNLLSVEDAFRCACEENHFRVGVFTHFNE